MGAMEDLGLVTAPSSTASLRDPGQGASLFTFSLHFDELGLCWTRHSAGRPLGRGAPGRQGPVLLMADSMEVRTAPSAQWVLCVWA